MSRYKHCVEHCNAMIMIARNSVTEYSEALQKKHLILDAMEADINNFKRTGVLTCTLEKVSNSNEETTEEVTEPKKRGRTKERTIARRSSSLKENTKDPLSQETKVTGQALGENNNRTPNSTVKNVIVKLEKMSEQFFEAQSNIATVPIKQEKTDMPPPTMRPMRQTRKRKGTQNSDASNSTSRSLQIKEELIDVESKKRKPTARPANLRKPSVMSRESDVQITPEPMDTINLVETDEDEPEKPPKSRGRPKTKQKPERKVTNSSTDDQKSDVEEPKTVRATRTKTKTAAKEKEPAIEQATPIANQNHTDGSSTEEDKVKKSSKKTGPKKKNADASVYEDAVSDAENSQKNHVTADSKSKSACKNNPFVTPVHAPVQQMNETIVLNKHNADVEKVKNPVLMDKTVVKNKLPNGGKNIMDELMTDDEDVFESPVRPQKQKKTKQVFSPYENSPVKKRVAAFEKLGVEVHTNADIPQRMTRTKTKAKEQESESSENEVAKEQIPHPPKRAIPKLKNTPLADHRAKLKLSQSASLSAVKVSQAEFRERELRRKQKEEALSKKEALVQAEHEERLRKLEEKQQKAQQLREALEKERKQKKIEAAERLKQDKIKQLKAEKEEKLLKQKEEAARKLLHMKKAAEEKLKEGQNKIDNLNETVQVLSKVPLYLKYETPLLPTQDCYDSDDSHCQPPSAARWEQKASILETLKWMRYTEINKKFFFNNGPKTVDLTEIFPSIEPHKLKRTSSAIWNKSGMSVLHSMAEEEDEEVDQ